MFQFLVDFFGLHQRLSTTARNLVRYFKQNLEDDPDLHQHFIIENHDEELSRWAQSFCNIDTNGNMIIDKKELQEYVQQHYRSPLSRMLLPNSKDEQDVLHAAMEQFKSAAQEKEDVSEDACALTFNQFVRMMLKLDQVGKNPSDAVCKFYEFLKNATGALPKRDRSDKSAKIIETSAEWRNNINMHVAKYLEEFSKDAEHCRVYESSLIFFIAIRAFIHPDAKKYDKDKLLKFAETILSRPSALQHIRNRGRPHDETCLNHAYLLALPDVARLIVKLNRDLACSSYRGKVFYGENCLHIMIAKNDSKSNKMLDEAKWLLGFKPAEEYAFKQDATGHELKAYLEKNRSKLIHQPAIGMFFDKDDPDCKAYFGELPLSFAVSRNSYEFVNFLVVECNCCIDKRDKHGNTAAHLAVYHDNFAMFLFLWKLWDLGMDSGKGRSEQSRQLKTTFLELESNPSEFERGYTPLVYAAHLGKVEFFTKLWDHMGRNSTLDEEISPVVNGLMPLQWKWGSIRQFLYPLEQIDPIGQTHYFDSDVDEDETKMKQIALKSVPIFEHLKTAADLQPILSRMVLQKFKRDEVILQQGSESNGKMYIIKSGSCVAYKRDDENVLQKFSLSVRYFGELGTLGHQEKPQFKRRAATVIALVDSEIWELDLPSPIPALSLDSAYFLRLRQQAYRDSRNRPCVLNEALSQVQSNIMRKPQQEESDHLKLLNTGFLKELIDKKWKRFGEEKFNSFLRWSLFMYVINLLSTIMRYPGKHSSSSFLVEQIYTCISTGVLTPFEDLGLFSQWTRFQYCLCVLPDLIVIVSSVYDLRRSFRYRAATYGMQWKPNLLHRLSSTLAVLTLSAYVLETLMLFGANCFRWVPVIMVIACSGVRSVQIIVYLLASASQGEFVVMIMTIMFQDMPQFMMIAVVLTFAFSQIFLLVRSLVGSNVSSPATVLGSLEEFWNMLFANFKHVFGDGFEQHKENVILEMCSLVAALAITIVLVNMLIASMGETFNRVREAKASEMLQMYQKAKMIAMIELGMSLDERRESQKKFWVDVKPSGCLEKRPFMVIHDDGVAATANPESANFPDSCEVSLHMPDAKLLHQKIGTIVGVRDAFTHQYQVQLQDQDICHAYGQMIVTAGEDSLRWRNRPEDTDEASLAAQAYSKTKKLPTRPYIPKHAPPRHVSASPTPNTKATGYGPPPIDHVASPVFQRKKLAPADSSSCITAAHGGGADTSSGRCEGGLGHLAGKTSPALRVGFNVPQPAALAPSDAPVVSSPQFFASPQPASGKRPKRKPSAIEQRETSRARVSPVAAPSKVASKRARDEVATASSRSQRNLRSKK